MPVAQGQRAQASVPTVCKIPMVMNADLRFIGALGSVLTSS